MGKKKELDLHDPRASECSCKVAGPQDPKDRNGRVCGSPSLVMHFVPCCGHVGLISGACTNAWTYLQGAVLMSWIGLDVEEHGF